MDKSLQAISDEEFNHYYARYFGQIKTYVYRYLRDNEISKDITQNVFTKLFQNRNKLRNDNLRNWLYKVAYNDIMDYLKKNPAVSSLDQGLVEPFTTNGPQSVAQEQYEREVIQSVLMKLPQSQRTAILLKDVKGYSYEQIAETMNLTHGAVKSLIFRGRQKFIKYYREVKKDEVQ